MNNELEETNQVGKPQVVKNVSITGPIGTYIDHVDHLHLGGYHDESPERQPPTGEQMCQIVEKMVDRGLWYAGTSWAVVYRLYQIWGYKSGINQFVRDVADWPFKHRPKAECTADAVSKPLRTGKFVGKPATWGLNGATDAAVRLGLAIEAELTKILPAL